MEEKNMLNSPAPEASSENPQSDAVEEYKELSAEERLKERRKRIRPLVDDYFKWVKQILADNTLLLKGKTVKGLTYSVNQEK